MVALFSFLFPLFYFVSWALAFSFTAGTLSECDDLAVQWSGGTGPYQLLIIPAFGTPRNISIPASAYADGKGSYSMQLAFPKKQQIVLTMSDATGFGAGGSTDVLTVQPSKGGSCNTTDPGVAFPFQLNSALQQCRPFIFSGFDTAAKPVTIWMVVPGGTSLVLYPPSGAQTYSWIANVAARTSMMFLMTDAHGAQGGASDIKIVGASDDTTCLNDRSPSSTPARPTPTPTGSELSRFSPTSAPPSTTTTTITGVPISAIAGTVIGSLLFLAVIVTLGLFFLKNFKNKRDRKTKSIFGTNLGQPRRMQSDGDFFGSNPYGLPAASSSYYPHSPNSSVPLDNPFADSLSPNPANNPYAQSHSSLPYEPDPFQAQRPAYPPSTRSAASLSLDPFHTSGPPVLPMPGALEHLSAQNPEQAVTRDDESTTSAQRKAALAGVSNYQPSRFIVHTDAEDELPPPNEDGVVELPPMYSERRAPPKFAVANPSPPSPTGVPPHPYSASNVSPFS